MPDVFHPNHEPERSWQPAFASLPLESGPADGWRRLSARLDARARPRWPARLAIAAALVLGVALPWRMYGPHDVASGDAGGTSPASTVAANAGNDPLATATLPQLYTESAQLESLLQFARDDTVSSGAAAALAGELDARVASIDAALMQPGLSSEQQLSLWRDRVQALRSLTGFESTRRMLAAKGERYDGALARVD